MKIFYSLIIFLMSQPNYASEVLDQEAAREVISALSIAAIQTKASCEELTNTKERILLDPYLHFQDNLEQAAFWQVSLDFINKEELIVHYMTGQSTYSEKIREFEVRVTRETVGRILSVEYREKEILSTQTNLGTIEQPNLIDQPITQLLLHYVCSVE